MATTNRSSGETEPLPPLTESTTAATPSPLTRLETFFPRSVRSGTAKLLDAEIPRGMSGLTAQTWAQSPTLPEIRQGLYSTEGDERARQFETADTPANFHTRRKERRASQAPRASTEYTKEGTTAEVTTTDVPEKTSGIPDGDMNSAQKTESSTRNNLDLTHTPTVLDSDIYLTESGTYPNGYKFPPKHTWQQSCSIGFKAFLKFTFTTWVGALVTFYAVQVIGWGGMIFLLLCGGGDSRMCFLERPPGSGHIVKDCSSKHTSKSLWIEIDAQVLTALFCVTAFGLIPWRARDLWYWSQWRIWKEHLGLRKLAAAHKAWFRLPASHHLDPLAKATELTQDADAQAMVPYPLEKAPPPP